MTDAGKENTTWIDYNPVRITAGPGVVRRLFDIISPEIARGRLLMVTSTGFTARGVVAQIEAEARKYYPARPVRVFDGVTPNPELDCLDQIAAGLRGEGITGIIALGGGSVIDTAKALSVVVPADPDNPLDMALRRGKPCEWKDRIPVYAVPTTAGTGAEVTPFATVWDSGNYKKYSVAGETVYPVHALLDPELTLTLPPKETLCTGLDAISHAVESLWNKNRSPVSEALALKALSLANEALPVLLEHPDNLHFRSKMQQGSLLAGLAISRTRTAIAHAISYPLTIRFGVPHGLACSFILPGLIRHHTATLADGVVNAMFHQTLETLERMNLGAEMARYTKGVDLSKYINEMAHPQRAGNYNGTITLEDIVRLLHAHG